MTTESEEPPSVGIHHSAEDVAGVKNERPHVPPERLISEPQLPVTKDLDLGPRQASGRTQPRRHHLHSKLKTHQRLASHTKIPTKQAISTVSRPHLNRSKSTDGLPKTVRTAIKRNNRSMTKLSGLQPLTRTNSNPQKSGLRPLTKTMSNQLIKSNKSSTSLKGTAQIGLKTLGKRGKAILKLNEDLQDDEYDNYSGESDEEPDPVPEQAQPAEEPAPRNNGLESGIGQALRLSDYYKNGYDKPDKLDKHLDHSSDDLVGQNLYGGSLLLSQSTGLTKKVDPQAGGMEQYTVPELMESTKESISGISFKATPIEYTNTVTAQPVLTKPTGPNLYQPNQTIFNNLQRTNSQYLLNKKSQLQLRNNNFSDFLNSSVSNSLDHSTRTQQRLWLQRENLLMDVPDVLTLSLVSLNKMMFANYSSTNLREVQTPNSVVATPTSSVDTASNSFNNITGLLPTRHNLLQSRTEFERLNREYLNVRRHLNPVAESVNRVDKILGTSKINVPKKKATQLSIHDDHKHANTFKEFSPTYEEKEQEVHALLERMWTEALAVTKRPPQVQRKDLRLVLPARTVQPTTRKLAAQAAASKQSVRLEH